MNRRDLLKAFAALSATSVSSQLLAAPSTQNRFLLVFLRGGYDAANLLVPVSSNFYYETRPNIAIARPNDKPESASPLTTDWGLHPALRDTIFPMFQAGEAAFVPFAGIDDLTRSHFETQDSIELGQPLGGSRNYHSGFMNRLASVLNGNKKIAGLSYTDQLPIIMQGDARIANIAMRNVSKGGVDSRQSQIIQEMYGKTALGQQVAEGFTVRKEVSEKMQEIQKTQEQAAKMQKEAEQKMDAQAVANPMQSMSDAGINSGINTGARNAISTKGFELEATRIAQMMRDKYALGFVDVGGWDTHVNQGGAKGALAGKFEELGRGLAAYKNEMGSAWRNTTVVVVSEFGRTFRENGKQGTDHGHGSVYWVLGGGVNGGKVAGEQITLDAKTLFQNRDYPVLNDYRAVLGGLFAGIYGLNATQIDTIFPSATAKSLGLV
jgi:uncharacterized protein (DUF1501 family)